MTRTDRIKAILREGPSTASEIAVELGIDVRLASAHMADLRKRGYVDSKDFHSPLEQLSVVALYSLSGKEGPAPRTRMPEAQRIENAKAKARKYRLLHSDKIRAYSRLRDRRKETTKEATA